MADSLGIFYESFEGAHLELLGAKINNRIFGTLLGERVKILEDSFKTPGLYGKKWFGNNEAGEAVCSGIYIYTIKVNETLIAKKTISFLK